MRIGFSIAVLLAFVGCGHADAEYLTYSEWAALPSAARAYYISGLFDALTGVVNSPAEKYQKHYSDCIRDLNMRNVQLSENLRNYAAQRPAIQSRGVIGALIFYLIDLCGPVRAN